MKKRIRKPLLLTAAGLLAVSAVIGFLWYAGILFDIGIGMCFPPPGLMVDSMVDGKVFTWLDSDRNGVYDADEQPIGKVNVHFGPLSRMTDAAGIAGFVLFRPGCACNCGAGINITVDIPNGMRATTPSQLQFDEGGERYLFGFIQADN